MRDRLDPVSVDVRKLAGLLDAVVLPDEAELQARRARVDD
jgi:hypothetical protein